MTSLVAIVLLVAGFALLIKGGDWLVVGAAALARRLHVSDLVIGLTIVAFGTSAPELVVNVLASLKGSHDIAIGNIVGSNIANILLIIGCAAIICPIRATSDTVWKEIPFTLLAAFLLWLLPNDHLIDGGENQLSREDGLILLAFFGVFMYYIYHMVQSQKELLPAAPKGAGIPSSLLKTILGLACLVIGGQLVIKGALIVAGQFGLSESYVGLTIVALGTSLPELATAGVAAYRRNTDIAIGNVVGSNIFNIFFVLGISSVIQPIPFNVSNNVDIGVVALATVLLFTFTFIGRPRQSVNRTQGVVLFVLYIVYLTFATIRG